MQLCLSSIRKQLASDFDVSWKERKNIKSEAQFCLLLTGLPQGTDEKELKGWIASFYSESQNSKDAAPKYLND